jgi:6-methylsalicylate decarboxylase
LQAVVGPDRILFGTDIPFAPEFIAAESVRGLGLHAQLDDAGRALVERGNALRLFPRIAEQVAGWGG